MATGTPFEEVPRDSAWCGYPFVAIAYWRTGGQYGSGRYAVPSWCLDCAADYQRCRRAGIKLPPKLMKRRCRYCDKPIPATKRSGSIYCGRSCKGKDRAAATMTDATRDEKLQRKYGITLADYRAMEAAQGGACAICATVPTEGWILDVDHCHTTGAVRGLLCHRCNKAIGLFDDDPATMVKAVAYLEAAA